MILPLAHPSSGLCCQMLPTFQVH